MTSHSKHGFEIFNTLLCGVHGCSYVATCLVIQSFSVDQLLNEYILHASKRNENVSVDFEVLS